MHDEYPYTQYIIYYLRLCDYLYIILPNNIVLAIQSDRYLYRYNF